jgi:hypothetical protein
MLGTTGNTTVKPNELARCVLRLHDYVTTRSKA